MHADIPNAKPSAVADDVGGFLCRRSPDGIFGNHPRDVGMERGPAKKNLIGLLSLGFRKRARMAFRIHDHGLELGPRPCGHIEGDRAEVAWLVHIDRRKPLLESIGRCHRLPERRLGRERTRDDKPRDREPGS